MKKIRKLISTFQKMRQAQNHVLSMNRRNLEYVYPNNSRCNFPIADNKLETKAYLRSLSIPMPVTHRVYDSFFSLRKVESDLQNLNDFVIKPAQGSGGGGILVIVENKGSELITAGGRIVTLQNLRTHMSDVIFGIYSNGLSDQVIVESRLVQHKDMDILSPSGLTDLRVIVHQNTPVMAMLRIPTSLSDGKANLHQGAMGAGIDMENGNISHAIHNNVEITAHIDSGHHLIGRQVPYWAESIAIAETVAYAVPLKYLGIDIALTESGPVLLELNVRPGIAIQNANDLGLYAALRSKAGAA
ncbi:MAG: hypothetical protein OEZ47_08880 [Gammaproteobacteria bacterium]|nr:hypothetical protein [Gammaproteobacteria bacterium]